MDSALPLLLLYISCFIYVCLFTNARGALLSLDSVKMDGKRRCTWALVNILKIRVTSYMQLYSLVRLSVCYKSVEISLLGHDALCLNPEREIN